VTAGTAGTMVSPSSIASEAAGRLLRLSADRRRRSDGLRKEGAVECLTPAGFACRSWERAAEIRANDPQCGGS
jgi:hypothetical protein